MTEGVVDSLDTPLPADPHLAVQVAFQNEGAKSILGDILEWEPEMVEEGESND